jgi:3-oxoacyl-[acyl-carrier-protein] synthase-3
MKQHFTIVGSARALPECRVTAEELDQRLGLEPGWTASHTGVLVRHRTSGADEAAALTRQVCAAALADAGRQLADIDLIIDASLSVQQPIPCNAALVQEILGPAAAGIPCFDVHASCLGFLAALNVVNGLFAAGGHRRALVVCAETPSFGVNWDEPESACLMGDGAAAFVLEAGVREQDSVFLFETYAEGARLCEVRGGGHRLPAFTYSDTRRGAYQFHMDGKAVHRFASQRFPAMLRKGLDMAGLRVGEVDIVPHQASGPALEFMRRRLGIPLERFHVTIADHGNMVAASIPYVLDAVRRRLPPGAPLMALGTAAGYTQAVAIFRL